MLKSFTKTKLNIKSSHYITLSIKLIIALVLSVISIQQLRHFPLISMFQSENLDVCINRICKCALRLVY